MRCISRDPGAPGFKSVQALFEALDADAADTKETGVCRIWQDSPAQKVGPLFYSCVTVMAQSFSSFCLFNLVVSLIQEIHTLLFSINYGFFTG